MALELLLEICKAIEALLNAYEIDINQCLAKLNKGDFIKTRRGSEIMEGFYQVSLKVKGGLVAANESGKRQIVWSFVTAQAIAINQSRQFLRAKFRHFMLAKHEYLKARRMI